jgi:HPt (histidine-containing phosphotransfer) domain-containing protein
MWQADPQRYALLLTDCHMPHLDGFGLTAAIRTHETPGRHLPIIAITANALQGEAQRCREHGMDDYLSKPLRMDELADRLDRWLPLDDAKGTQAAPESDTGSPHAVAAPQIDTDLAVWNLAVLTALVGNNPEVERRLLEKFLAVGQRQVDTMVHASGRDDRETVVTVSHMLKSSARSVGAMKLGELCENLEMTAHTLDANRLQALATDLEAQFAAVSDSIHRRLAMA